MSRRRIWVFALLFLPLLAAQAETVTLTIDEAVRRALEQSLDLKKGAIDLAEAGYSAKRLWSEIFPDFSLSAGLNFLPSTPLFTDPGFSYNDDGLSYSLSAGVSFSFNPSFYSSMKQIELAYRAELLSYEDARKQLETEVIKRFLSLVTNKANIAYLEENLRLVTQNMASDRVARQNGLLSELDWLNSQLSVETARYDLAAVRANYQNALDSFLALLGMEPDSEVVFDGTIEIAPLELDPERLILEYLPKRPDIVAMRQEIERLLLSKNMTALSARAPSLDLSANWQGGSGSGGLDAPFTDNVSGRVTLTIPVDSWIPGTRRNQDVRAAGAGVEKARLDLQNTESRAKTEIRLLVTNLRGTWENLTIARMRVDIAGRTVQAANAGFRQGAVEFRDLEDSRSDLNDARQRLLEGELAYQTLLLDLAAALNVEWKSLAALQINGSSQ